MCYNRNMRKKRLIFYCITLLMFCQVSSVAAAFPAVAASEAQESAVKEKCETILNELKNIQKTDARTRVYFGGLYETILTKFVVPFNVRTVENSLSSAELVENQNKISEAKELFANDFVSYQQDLESLVTMDCRTESGKFYDQLVKVRQKRKIVEQDTLKMRSLLSVHVKLANGLKGKL